MVKTPKETTTATRKHSCGKLSARKTTTTKAKMVKGLDLEDMRGIVGIRDAAMFIHMFAMATASIVNWYDDSISDADFADRLQAELDERIAGPAERDEASDEHSMAIPIKINAKKIFIWARKHVLSFREQIFKRLRDTSPFASGYGVFANAMTANMPATLPKLWDDSKHKEGFAKYTEALIVARARVSAALVFHCAKLSLKDLGEVYLAEPKFLPVVTKNLLK